MSGDGSKAMEYTDIDVSAEACAARLNLKAANDLCRETVDTADYEVATELRDQAMYALRAIQNRRNCR